MCPPDIARSRAWYALLIVAVMAVGLVWRSHWLPLTPFLSKYGGDALWALLVFLGFGFVFKKSPTCRLALAALAFAWAIEFSQLYHAPWIDAIRATRPGALVLGSVFNPPDLPAYALGIALGTLAELVHRKSRRFAKMPPSGIEPESLKESL